MAAERLLASLSFKNHPLVQYALAGMDNQLFVSQYQLELPQEQQIQAFLETQLRETEE
jgi:hypothetical protein